MIWFSAKKAKMGKTFVAFCACGVANTLFMNGLRKRRRRKDAFYKCHRVSESVVKDRERCCFLIASIVHREGEIICKNSGQWSEKRWLGFVVSQPSPGHATDEELSLHPSEQRSLPSLQRAKIARYHPSEQKSLAGDHESVGTPAKRRMWCPCFMV